MYIQKQMLYKQKKLWGELNLFVCVGMRIEHILLYHFNKQRKEFNVYRCLVDI